MFNSAPKEKINLSDFPSVPGKKGKIEVTCFTCGNLTCKLKYKWEGVRVKAAFGAPFLCDGNSQEPLV